MTVQELKEAAKHDQECIWGYEGREHDRQRSKAEQEAANSLANERLEEVIGNARSRAEAAESQVSAVEHHL